MHFFFEKISDVTPKPNTAPACDSGTQEAEAGAFQWIQGQPWLHTRYQAHQGFVSPCQNQLVAL